MNHLGFVIACVAGWVNRHQQHLLEYLQEEVRVLKELQRGRGLRFSHEQRCRLAAKANKVRFGSLCSVAGIVTPQTLLRWHRKLIAQKYDSSGVRKPGRPRKAEAIRELVVRMAEENRLWGYTRISGALYNLGYEISRSTVCEVLKTAGIEPAPERGRKTSWREFLKTHWEMLAACDFFNVEVWTLRGLVRYDIFFVIRLAADLLSSSSSPNPLYIGQPGYMSDFDVNLPDATDDVTIRKHNEAATTGRFLGTTTEWDSLSSSDDADYTFAPNTEYVGVFSITRTGADSVDIFSSMSQGSTLMDSHMESDTSGIANNFGMAGFWANSNTFGSSSSLGAADNGINFSNIKIELVSPSTEPPTLSIVLDGSDVVLSWPANGTSGYTLESATNIMSPTWSAAGTPTVVGDLNHVTNSASGRENYYRLNRP